MDSTSVTLALPNFLRQTAWARTLTPVQMARVEAETLERQVAAGALVCRKGDLAEHWVGLVDGLLKMSSVSHEGKTVTFTGLCAGSWFGEGSLLKSERRKYDVIALRDSRIALMPRATFHWLLDSSIGFNRFLLTQINERLGLFISLVEFDRMLHTDARVARCLAALFNDLLNPNLGRHLQISQEEIGYLCSTSRQRTNQALQTLEKQGLLRVEYGSITILDLERLRAYGM